MAKFKKGVGIIGAVFGTTGRRQRHRTAQMKYYGGAKFSRRSRFFRGK